ncbi:MAG: HEAT repeat domain-containing protein [Planctomycetota bacterium]
MRPILTTGGRRTRDRARTLAFGGLLLGGVLACTACGRATQRVVTTGDLDDPNPARRTEAVSLVRKERDLGAVPVLIEMLDDPDPGVRLAASATLEDLTGRRTGYRPWGDATQQREEILAWRRWWAGRQGAAGQPGPTPSRSPPGTTPPSPSVGRGR